MRRIYVKRSEHVDSETGEIVATEEQSSFFVKSKHFVKLYLDGLYLLRDLSGGARSILDVILVEMEFNENTVYISKQDKVKLAQILDKSEYTIRNYIYELEEGGIIAKVGTNVYKVNPSIFEKGGQAGDDKIYEPKKPTGKKGESPL